MHARHLDPMVDDPRSLPKKIGLPIPVSKYKWWDTSMPLFTKGEYPDGRKASVEGGAPIKFQYYADKDGSKLSPTPTDYLIHFALYGPDGTYLASSDSDVFTVH